MGNWSRSFSFCWASPSCQNHWAACCSCLSLIAYHKAPSVRMHTWNSHWPAEHKHQGGATFPNPLTHNSYCCHSGTIEWVLRWCIFPHHMHDRKSNGPCSLLESLLRSYKMACYQSHQCFQDVYLDVREPR